MTASAARTLILPRQAASPRGFVPSATDLRWPDKHPNAVLDYWVDVRNVMEADDSIALASAAIIPSEFSGLTLVGAPQVEGTMIGVSVKWGLDNVDYRITLTIGTSDGRVKVIPVSLLMNASTGAI